MSEPLTFTIPRRHVYRTSGLFTLVILALAVGQVLFGKPPVWPGLVGIGLGAGILYIGLFLHLHHRQIELSPTLIRGRAKSGRTAEFAWGEPMLVEKVTDSEDLFSTVTIRRPHASSKDSVALPLAILKDRRFQEAVQRYGGPRHPLALPASVA